MLQGNYTSGNYNNYTLGSKLDLRLNVKNSSFELASSIRYTEYDPGNSSFQLKENEKYNVISYSHYWKKLKLLCFSEQEKSYLRKVDNRYSIGVGIGYKFIESKTTKFEISEVILPEQVNYINSAYNITSLRYSTRIKFIYTENRFKFSTINLIQPSLWNSKDVDYTNNFNIRSSTTFDFAIIKELSIGLSNDFIIQTYVSKIFPAKRSYDNSITFYLKVSI